jgi:hypothetical protein
MSTRYHESMKRHDGIGIANCDNKLSARDDERGIDRTEWAGHQTPSIMLKSGIGKSIVKLTGRTAAVAGKLIAFLQPIPGSVSLLIFSGSRKLRQQRAPPTAPPDRGVQSGTVFIIHLSAPNQEGFLVARQLSRQFPQGISLQTKIGRRVSFDRSEQVPPAGHRGRSCRTVGANTTAPKRLQSAGELPQVADVTSALQPFQWRGTGRHIPHGDAAKEAWLAGPKFDLRFGSRCLNCVAGFFNQLSVENRRAQQILLAERHFDAEMYPSVALTKAVAALHQLHVSGIMMLPCMNDQRKLISPSVGAHVSDRNVAVVRGWNGYRRIIAISER